MVERAEVVMAGAGPAGLAAARTLQRAGVHVLVCEAGDDIGGRVRTDVIDGFRLDRGFQVLLPAYPAAREMVDVSELRLQYFTPGVIADGQALAPPWRHRGAVRDLLAFAAGRPRDVAALLAMSARDALAPARRIKAGEDATIAAFEVTAADLMAGLVRQGLGVAMLPSTYAPRLSGVVTVPVTDAPARGGAPGVEPGRTDPGRVPRRARSCHRGAAKVRGEERTVEHLMRSVVLLVIVAVGPAAFGICRFAAARAHRS